MGQRRRGDKTAAPQLTERQVYWLKHLRACESSGLTAKAYAKKHRLSIYALYQARKDHRRREARASRPQRPSVTFAKVQSGPSTERDLFWRIRFPNGAVIELEAPRASEDQMQLLQSIASLS